MSKVMMSFLQPLAQPDASGGLGSVGASLRSEVTRGIFGLAEGWINAKYGIGGMSDGRATVNAEGHVRPAAAEAEDVKPVDSLAQWLKDPRVIAGGALVVALVAFLAFRK